MASGEKTLAGVEVKRLLDAASETASNLLKHYLCNVNDGAGQQLSHQLIDLYAEGVIGEHLRESFARMTTTVTFNGEMVGVFEIGELEQFKAAHQPYVGNAIKQWDFLHAIQPVVPVTRISFSVVLDKPLTDEEWAAVTEDTNHG